MAEATPHDGFLTTAEAAIYLGVHAKTVERLARAGELRSARLGRRYRFKTEWLDALLTQPQRNRIDS